MGRGKVRARTERTLGEIADAYLADLALRAKPKTLQAARSALQVVRREFGDTLPDRDALEAWRRARVAAGRSNRTVNRDLTTLGAALAFALDRGWIGENPVRKLRRLPQKGRHRRRVARALPDDEVRRLLAAAASIDARYPKRFPRAPLLRALFETGCRWGELVAATWGDLDSDRALLRLRGETTKTDRERHVPLSAGLLDSIHTLRAAHVRVRGENPTGSDRIWLSPNGRPWASTGNYLRYVEDALRLAHIPKRDAAGRIFPRPRDP